MGGIQIRLTAASASSSCSSTTRLGSAQSAATPTSEAGAPRQDRVDDASAAGGRETSLVFSAAQTKAPSRQGARCYLQPISPSLCSILWIRDSRALTLTFRFMSGCPKHQERLAPPVAGGGPLLLSPALQPPCALADSSSVVPFIVREMLLVTRPILLKQSPELLRARM